jgi:hypothetical protein
MGERGTLSPIPVLRRETSGHSTPKFLINSGFWRLRRFLQTKAFDGKIHITATRTDTRK